MEGRRLRSAAQYAKRCRAAGFDPHPAWDIAPIEPIGDGPEGIGDALELDAAGRLSAPTLALDMRHSHVGDLQSTLVAPSGPAPARRYHRA